MRIGIIVEGFSERIVLKSPAFTDLLQRNSLELVSDVVNLKGKGNLNTQRMQSQVQLLRDLGAETILVLRDLDDMPCITSAKQEVYQAADVKICIAVKELEAWFLADSKTLSNVFRTNFYFDKPEEEANPSYTLSQLSLNYTNRGASDKKLFAMTMNRNGFSIENAANHPHCPSANYFLTKLQSLRP
ncbi:DUF4276 family protein [Larkinella sp. GY13]|uniref:DUF4276 family protein n=1 Tax=Larkinella sp. GY13 TaxID=3453720 RepID=UPI003EE8DFE1